MCTAARTQLYRSGTLRNWVNLCLRDTCFWTRFIKEPAKIRPLYPRGQRPLYPTRCRVFSSNVINTGLIQPFGPAPVGSTSKKTLIFHCGRCETLPTPAITAFFQKAGVGKFSQRPLSKLKVSVCQIRLRSGVGKVSQHPLSIIKVWQLLYK